MILLDKIAISYSNLFAKIASFATYFKLPATKSYYFLTETAYRTFPDSCIYASFEKPDMGS